MAHKRHQRGLSIISWLLIIGIAIFFAMVGIKSLPVYMNHFKVQNILKNTAGQPGAAEESPNEIRKTLEKRFDIDMVKYVDYKDVKVVGQTGERTLTLEYEVRVHMFYNVDTVYMFEEEIPLGN